MKEKLFKTARIVTHHHPTAHYGQLVTVEHAYANKFNHTYAVWADFERTQYLGMMDSNSQLDEFCL